MLRRRLGRVLAGRRDSPGSHAVAGLRAVAGGRRWAAVELLAVATVSHRWRAAGMAIELGRRLWHRAR